MNNDEVSNGEGTAPMDPPQPPLDRETVVKLAAARTQFQVIPP